MDPIRDIELIALHSGALDPSAERALRERIAASPALAARFAALRPDPPPASADRGWRVPRPRAYAESSLSLTFSSVGSTRRIARIPDRPDAGERLFVLLVREQGFWRCAWPPEARYASSLATLPLREGGREFSWDPAMVPGAEAWAIALPPISLPIEWSAPEQIRWNAVISAVMTGQVPVLHLEGEEKDTDR